MANSMIAKLSSRTAQVVVGFAFLCISYWIWTAISDPLRTVINWSVPVGAAELLFSPMPTLGAIFLGLGLTLLLGWTVTLRGLGLVMTAVMALTARGEYMTVPEGRDLVMTHRYDALPPETVRFEPDGWMVAGKNLMQAIEFGQNAAVGAVEEMMGADAAKTAAGGFDAARQAPVLEPFKSRAKLRIERVSVTRSEMESFRSRPVDVSKHEVWPWERVKVKPDLNSHLDWIPFLIIGIPVFFAFYKG